MADPSLRGRQQLREEVCAACGSTWFRKAEFSAYEPSQGRTTAQTPAETPRGGEVGSMEYRLAGGLSDAAVDSGLFVRRAG
jgi:hypothetical protein